MLSMTSSGGARWLACSGRAIARNAASGTSLLRSAAVSGTIVPSTRRHASGHDVASQYSTRPSCARTSPNRPWCAHPVPRAKTAVPPRTRQGPAATPAPPAARARPRRDTSRRPAHTVWRCCALARLSRPLQPPPAELGFASAASSGSSQAKGARHSAESGERPGFAVAAKPQQQQQVCVRLRRNPDAESRATANCRSASWSSSFQRYATASRSFTTGEITSTSFARCAYSSEARVRPTLARNCEYHCSRFESRGGGRAPAGTPCPRQASASASAR